MMNFPHTGATRLFLTILALCVASSNALHAEETNSSTPDQTTPSTLNTTAEPKHFLDYIPKWIDAAPTVFPEQSDVPAVPAISETEGRTWLDRKQRNIRDWADRSSHKMDAWFGEVDPEKPASATIRVMLDNYWDEYDQYELKPRIRGKIRLPRIEKKLSVIFGDDSLDDEFNNNIANSNTQPNADAEKKFDAKQTRDSNGSIALRWSNFSEKLPFETDVDLGIRSGDDIYLRLKAEKNWALSNDFYFNAEQIYRYGSDSENYVRSNLELSHARPNAPFLSDQFSLIYADEQEDDLVWQNRIFRQHQFFAHNNFNYGIHTGGYYNNNDLRLNSWGPFVSWRQPLWREWFYVQGDLNYFNDHREDRDHHISTFVRLEALF